MSHFSQRRENGAAGLLTFICLVVVCLPCASSAGAPDAASPLVSYQYLDTLAYPPAQPNVISPVVSYQYYDWATNLISRSEESQLISYFYGFGMGPVVILSQPLSQFVQLGGTATFTVGADGQPPLSYQWWFDRIPQEGATSTSLSVMNARLTNAGEYSATVSNPYGSVTSSAAQLVFLVQTNRRPEPTQIPTFSAPTSDQLKVFANGLFQTNVPLNLTKMTIVLTHGWTPIGLASPPFGSASWPTTMATTFALAGVTNVANIVAWDWTADSESPWFNPLPAWLKTASQGEALGTNLLATLGAGYTNAIHLIGHSFGTLVNGVAANYIHGDAPKEKPPWTVSPQRTHLTISTMLD